MKRTIQRQLGLLADRALSAIGLVRASKLHSTVLDDGCVVKEGHLFLDCKQDGVLVRTIDLGKNTLTYTFHVTVAKILARKAAQVQAVVGTATFPNGKDGYDYTDSVFPVKLYIGVDPTPSTPTDYRLGYYLTESDVPGAAPIGFDLARVIIQDSKAEYDAINEPINVAFEFDIPQGTLRQGIHAEATPYLLREFGLYDNSGADPHPIVGAPAVLGDPQVDSGSPSALLARKVADVIKLDTMSFTVRWEIRT